MSDDERIVCLIRDMYWLGSSNVTPLSHHPPGCEVSLWVAEQFASDLQKSFPKLFIKAVSSNKLLGLFGQELAMPCTGFPYSQKSLDMKDPIVIIVRLVLRVFVSP